MPEYRKPKNVGLMFFADEPDKFFPYAQIDVVAFPEGLGGNVIDEQTFKGPLISSCGMRCGTSATPLSAEKS